MLLGTHYWAYFGTLYLIIMTFQDLFNNMTIDDRRNWFMMGATIALISHLGRPFWYYLLVGLLVFIMISLFNKYNTLAKGDTSALTWIFIGFGFLSISHFIIFSINFLLILILWATIKNGVFNYKEKVAFFPVILVSFISACWFTGSF